MLVPTKIHSQEINNDTKLIQIEEIQKYNEALRLDLYSKELTAKAEQLIGTRGGQCLPFARKFSGMGRDKGTGLAKNIKVNSKTPQVGAVIALRMSKYGHVGVVLFTTEDSVVYADSNGQWRQIVAIRKLPLKDKRIRGYVVL